MAHPIRKLDEKRITAMVIKIILGKKNGIQSEPVVRTGAV